MSTIHLCPTLHDACRVGHHDCMLILVAHAQTNYGDNINALDNGGETPLFIACDNGYVECVRTCITHGADVNIRCSDEEETPLSIACYHGYLECTELLIKHGASINIRTGDGDTPLDTAICYNHPDIIDLLLQAGASLNEQDSMGHTVFHTAVLYGSQTTIMKLLDYGADPTIKNRFGQTALDLCKEATKELIQNYDPFPIKEVSD